MRQMTNKERAAFFMANKAHFNQKRKYVGDPYILHPVAVYVRVAGRPGTTEAMACAALLHDVVEDTDVTLADVREAFGDEVATLVDWLTDDKTVKGNRAFRKQKVLERLAQAPAEVQTIKLADLIDNTATIVKHDPNFAKVYLKEKAELLKVLTKGDEYLRQFAYATVMHATAMLASA